MTPIYKFVKDHVKILDRDVRIVLIVDDIIVHQPVYLRNTVYLWNIRVQFYSYDKLTFDAAVLDKECTTTDTFSHNVIWDGFDVVGLMMKFCRMYEENLIVSNVENSVIQSLEQKIKEWDGSFEVENKEIE